jgi:hypothetical protein
MTTTTATRYELSTSLATPSVFLFVAYIGLFQDSTRRPFSVLTNLCYASVGLQRLIASYTQQQTSAATLGLFAASPFVYLLLGASSFAFHEREEKLSAAHYFDILAGLLLLVHVTYVVAATNVYWLVARAAPQCKDACVLLCAIGFMAAVFVVVLNFEHVHLQIQNYVYLTLGPLTALLYVPLRAKLAGSSRAGWLLGAAESSVTLTAVLSAMTAKCGLMGRSCEDGADRDFFHGQMHYLMAVGTAICYTRVAQAARAIDTRSGGACVCDSPILDRVGLTLLFVYSAAVVVLKESRARLEVSETVLFLCATLLAVHAALAIARIMVSSI